MRRAQPPDFRYVGLVPGRSPVARIGVTTVPIAASGALLWTTGHQAIALVMTLATSAWAAVALARHGLLGLSARGAREVSMAIVPWGVVVSPDTEARTLRWPAIRSVRVDASHTLRGGTPVIESSLVTVETDREVFAGRSPGAVALERLVANLDAYAEESSCPVARDLHGHVALDPDGTEPVVEALFRCGSELCRSRDGAHLLALPTAGYRTVTSNVSGPETLEVLRGVLRWDGQSSADPRALAAIVAGLLGARALVPELVRLVSCPHPVVAACAKASALRLGASRMKAGSTEELSAFLFEEDLEAITRWSGPMPDAA